jgi:AraC family transcriptional regulator
MILEQFPDLVWLKAQIAQRFQNRRGYGNLPLDAEGFPSVIIHTRTKQCFRPDITGPISLFLNLQGSSHCSVDGRRRTIPSDHYFISNRFQPYTLEIENKSPVETFNIHFGEAFSEGLFSALLTSSDTILNNGLHQKPVTVSFHNQLYRKDATFIGLVRQLQANAGKGFDKILFEEHLGALLLYLVKQQENIQKQIARMPPLKPATRTELFRRLSYALDWLHAQTSPSIDLGEMATAACLSKFHFLRLFKQAYGLSPYQYWQQLRMTKAENFLKNTDLSVQEIAGELGYEDSASFSRLFYQRKGVYPSQFRTAAN